MGSVTAGTLSSISQGSLGQSWSKGLSELWLGLPVTGSLGRTGVQPRDRCTGRRLSGGRAPCGSLHRCHSTEPTLCALLSRAPGFTSRMLGRLCQKGALKGPGKPEGREGHPSSGPASTSDSVGSHHWLCLHYAAGSSCPFRGLNPTQRSCPQASRV